MLQSCHELGEQLGSTGATSDYQVSEGYKKIREEFDYDSGVLRKGGADNRADMHKLRALLAQPLLSSEARLELLERQATVDKTLHSEYFSNEAQAGKSTSVKDQNQQQSSQENISKNFSSNVAKTIAAWKLSPLLAVLESERQEDSNPEDSLAADTMEKIESVNWTARELLANKGRYDAQILSNREQLSRYAHRARIAASLLTGPLENNPIDQLRRYDLQQLVLWHAERSLNGFWHTTASDSPKTVKQIVTRRDRSQTNQRPYFDKAASDYLKFAQQIYETAPKDVEAQVDRIEELHSMRNRASRTGLKIAAASRPVIDSPQSLNADVTVTSSRENGVFPPGEAALYAADARGRIENSSPWGSISMPPSEIGQTQQAMLSNVSDANLRAIVFFRGNEYRREFRANNFRGAVVEYSPPVYDRQSVTLFGDHPSPPSVVFILDCSYSMSEKVETEISGTKKRARMNVAADALDEMLRELSERDASRPRVGVRFFGHRVGWNTTTGLRLENQSASSKRIPVDLHPGEDVERVLSLGDFLPEDFGRVSKQLKSVRPLGVTPVNLAILNSLESDFGQELEEAAKSIIVITDGKNDQSNSSLSGLNSVTVTQTRHVVGAWDRLALSGVKIPVFIVGFGIPADERGTAVKEFQEIATHTGGSVVTADSGAELIEQLRKRLDVNGYEVLGPNERPVVRDSNTGESKRIELNTEVMIPERTFPLAADFEVIYQSLSKQVRFEGGEALDLQVAERESDLVSIPFSASYRSSYPEEAASTQLFPGPTSRSNRNLLLRVHPPLRANRQVKFRISVQDESSHFTPRPKEVWVEIVPEGGEQSYLFNDPFFEPLTPVPVIAFTASNWPEQVDQARVRFWCSYDKTPSVLPIQLVEVRQRKTKATQFRDVPGVPGIQVRVRLESLGKDGYRVLVDERSISEDAAIGAIRVWLDSTDESLRPASISRQIDTANRLGQHAFVFRETNEREFARRITVQVASASKIKENALQLKDAKGLTVGIVDHDDTHVPTGTGVGRN